MCTLMQVAKALKLPGSSSAPDELRVMLAADLFVLTESVVGEKVTNGIVTRAITTWLSEREHARQACLPLRSTPCSSTCLFITVSFECSLVLCHSCVLILQEMSSFAEQAAGLCDSEWLEMFFFLFLCLVAVWVAELQRFARDIILLVLSTEHRSVLNSAQSGCRWRCCRGWRRM